MVMQFDVRNAVNQCQVKMRQIMIGLYLGQISRCAMLWFSRFFAISPYPLLLSQPLAL